MIKNETKEIEATLMKFNVVDQPRKRTIELLPDDFKDLILEIVLKQMVENSEMKGIPEGAVKWKVRV